MARFHNGMRPIHPGEILREDAIRSEVAPRKAKAA